ncbi:MAG: response regulator [Cyanobacteria bacterium]|nr:response regulator [Cyanobacteriota bacterium]MDW8202519.1 response regulator [Cyanobacteriota bacterium SKYGB_h_bin112]
METQMQTDNQSTEFSRRYPPSKGDILIVDDTPDNLRVLSAMLTSQGFNVRKALTGQRAISSVEADRPDLILLDIKMPGMDGYTVCQHLKANPHTSHVPIIFISALDDAIDKVKAFVVGGVDYITKPFQEIEVLARITHQLHIQQLQQQLMQQNEELARSNRELEQFAYVVSHDLQQPLQSITGFVKLLQLKYEHQLDDVAIDYINRVYTAGNRMQRLIHDLLTYSRIGKQQSFGPVDCNVVVKQMLETFLHTGGSKRPVITCEVLPVVMGNETQIMQLFQNLVGNAVKFVNPGTTPHVSIAAVSEPDYWLFRIQDNGIGIEADQINRVFEMFQRTQAATKYDGSGIGLATCKKIVENHGGKIWIESQVQVGTTIYFTLPKIKMPPMSQN